MWLSMFLGGEFEAVVAAALGEGGDAEADFAAVVAEGPALGQAADLLTGAVDDGEEARYLSGLPVDDLVGAAFGGQLLEVAFDLFFRCVAHDNVSDFLWSEGDPERGSRGELLLASF
jgi:hypothetical protein